MNLVLLCGDHILGYIPRHISQNIMSFLASSSLGWLINHWDLCLPLPAIYTTRSSKVSNDFLIIKTFPLPLFCLTSLVWWSGKRIGTWMIHTGVSIQLLFLCYFQCHFSPTRNLDKVICMAAFYWKKNYEKSPQILDTLYTQ